MAMHDFSKVNNMTAMEIRIKALELAVATIDNESFACFMARAERIEAYILSAKQE